jgi:hypothetical protein
MLFDCYDMKPYSKYVLGFGMFSQVSITSAPGVKNTKRGESFKTIEHELNMRCIGRLMTALSRKANNGEAHLVQHVCCLLMSVAASLWVCGLAAEIPLS